MRRDSDNHVVKRGAILCRKRCRTTPGNPQPSSLGHYHIEVESLHIMPDIFLPEVVIES